MDLAVILDFHSVWYRDDLVQPRILLEELYFGLTGPTVVLFGLSNFGAVAFEFTLGAVIIESAVVFAPIR